MKTVPAATEVARSFSGTDGANPAAGVIRDSEGNLYWTTEFGGTLNGTKCEDGCGVVYKVDPVGNLNVLHAFSCGSDGRFPSGGVIRDPVGNLYGTTTRGGTDNATCSGGCGVVYKLDLTAQETVLRSFSGRADQNNPTSSELITDPEGTLYGNTYNGGTANMGVIYKLQP